MPVDWRFRSDDPDLEWPALLPESEARQCSLVDQLDQSQWWPPETLQAQQMRQLGSIVAYARKHVPHYRDTMRTFDFDARRPPSAESWAALPLLDREKVRRLGDRLHSREKSPLTRAFAKSTSGSTGAPLNFLWGLPGELLVRALWLRKATWYRHDVTAAHAEISMQFLTGNPAASAGGIQRFDSWAPEFASLVPGGRLAHMWPFAPTAELVDWLIRERPAYLKTYPSCAQALVHHCERHGLRIPGLRAILTMGEVVTPALRDQCRSVWDARIEDMYGAKELGYLAIQCPESGHYHLQGELNYIEILDPAGRPCGPGEIGRVVVSSLHNFAMPLFRYDLADYAEVGAPCRCGRGLPVLRRILGRSRNMLTLPGGEKRFAIHAQSVMIKVAAIQRYQLVQTALDEIEVRLVAERPLRPEEEAQVRAGLERQLGPSFRLGFRHVDEIEGWQSGKYQEFVSQLD